MTFLEAVEVIEAEVRPLLTVNLVKIYNELPIHADTDIVRTAIINVLDERNVEVA